jgi:excisionase family DNA binding protein
MICVVPSACLLPLLSDLRHHRTMGNGKDNRTNLWLRVSESLRISAWLPLGLALGWLATLATVVHSVGMAVAAWGATVSVVLLMALLVNRLRRSSTRNGPVSSKAPAGKEEAAQAGEASRETPPSPVRTDSGFGPGLRSGTSASANPPASELRVLTAEEVASVLRVDTDLVITSISNGEFPGNRIGNHWRVDQGALTRWLQGSYGEN